MVGRGKHYYSIYQKMQVRGREFDEIHDLVAVRILVGNVRECYAAMGVVHALWAPMPGRFKDYIAQPRYGVYQSLHTTVIGPEGKPLEVQIRTYDMHHTAEYGIASHWRYKETRGTHTGAGASVDEMAWMRQLLDWQREAGDAGEFLDNLRYEMAHSEIFVFTPKGDIHTLPAGSTPVDFAYSVHTEVGHRCIGAKVDGRLVPLERHAVQRAVRGDLHLQGAHARARAGTGWASSRRPGRRPRSGSTSPSRAARRPSSSARRPSPRRPAAPDCRCSG